MLFFGIARVHPSDAHLVSPKRDFTWYAHRVSFDQLRSFVAVAEERHVGRAAARLCLTQPPVTRQIQRLEDELGAKLFERRREGMLLSAAGARLLPHARDVLARIEKCAESVRMDDVVSEQDF